MNAVERSLMAEKAILLDERDRLRDRFAPRWRLPPSLGLLQNEENALRALIAQEQWTKEALLTSVFYETPIDECPEAKVLDFIIFKLREKMNPHGIEIETYRCKGYRLAPHMREKAKIVIAQELAAAGGHT